MPSTLLGVDTFDLVQTFGSAQPVTFFGTLDPKARSVSYVSSGLPIRATQLSRRSVRVESPEVRKAAKDFRRRFRVSDDMRRIYSRISVDPFMREAVRKYSGLRLTLNDPWETTAVFILSQFNNIKRIRLITGRMIERFGETSEHGVKAFPTAETLSRATIRELDACGMGFRSRYMKATAQRCAGGLDLDGYKGEGYGQVKGMLMGLPGIGDKVADCIALMGYGRLEAFPIDTWVKRTLERLYFNGRSTGIKRLHESVSGKWGGMQGYAQLYLYHHGRVDGNEA